MLGWPESIADAEFGEPDQQRQQVLFGYALVNVSVIERPDLVPGETAERIDRDLLVLC